MKHPIDSTFAEIEDEQAYVDKLFGKLDEEVVAANQRLNDVMLHVDPANPDAEALVRRETEYHALNEKIDRLNIAQLGLVFGRIDVTTQRTDLIDNLVAGTDNVDRRYIGRMGLDDRQNDYRTLLLDWRAPLARPFYLATTAHPEGVLHRRHIRTQGRSVVGVDDEVLSGVSAESAHSERADVVSETALYRAMCSARTGHMHSIVETIQREQDDIIRDPTRGVMVVEGGPGTGKTAVALHRVAYLLYTWRDQLAKTGVLIVGPNRSFLDYISRVLPELGETGVVLSTVGDLYPGISGTAVEDSLAREIKGSEEMVTVLRRLVQEYQQIPSEPFTIKIDGLELTVTPDIVKKARTRARRSRRPHNEARPLFTEQLTELLSHQMADLIGADPMGGKNLLSAADIAQLHDDLLEESVVAEIVDEYWPQLTPQDTLTSLLESQNMISTVAYDYDEETQEALWRQQGSPWAASDAALLDELAVIIGVPDPEKERAEQEKAWREQIEDAQDALEILTGSANTDLDDESDAEILSAHDVIDAETLARRQEVRDIRSTSQQAREDLAWAYGHVIVDEAQELTPMEWRMVMRRCPSRWMTLVGDTAQTSSPAGVDSWAEALEPFVSGRYVTHHLTINYRTPAEIMEWANKVLHVFAPDAVGSTALRQSGTPVRFENSDAHAIEIAQKLRQDDPSRLTAIIGPDSMANNEIFGVSDIKGLEYDHVVVTNPIDIVNGSPQGWQDLYVALTRATQSLCIIGDLPELS
ncbi:helicase [Corynebacterium diphtheriae]|nr:helicase [Corynebacterium diphtheriae]CAB0772127.1 helicase [Corynebacterium diphtheriae]CAB0797241.1 helicase [Corynebacterium diphtheriae]CAB0819521.1 helicase [Corynebacterium diphtheriae]CAB0903246.1 helicase [Corynebacterium diphtheriae]